MSKAIKALDVPGAKRGERLVVLTEHDYRQLLGTIEKLQDRLDGQLPADDGERLPAEMVNALVDGANPIQTWRKHRGMAAKDLAERLGISASHLSSLENGHREPSVGLLKALAEALDVDLDDLV